MAIATVMFLSGGGGAYLGSYLKKKGENLATHEDIDQLVEQVKAVTTATKQIETKISGDLWDRQRQWELRREILLSAAKKLSEIDNNLLGLHHFEKQLVGGEIEGEESKIRLKHDYVSSWNNCMHSFEETESLIYVTCSKETMRAFAELADLLRWMAGKIVKGDLEVYDKRKDDLFAKFTSVRIGIRKELGIGFDLIPQSKSGE
ncbi:MAG: hypothetical protein HY010_19970 [Acidobacteria bacterium]|nr:hypothetical protein [Acidobacteriota bacterium]